MVPRVGLSDRRQYPREGSMGIFTSREAVEEFVKDDPFVLGGVVRAWHVREWNEIFSGS